MPQRSMALGLLALVLGAAPASAQRPGTNQDETKVPPYTLPDPLLAADGTRVDSAAAWQTKRRPEILALFESQVYGKAPGRPSTLTFAVKSVDANALGGLAIRKQVAVDFDGPGPLAPMDVLLYLPKLADGPRPVFLGLNFRGNHAVHPDPGIDLPSSWMRDDRETPAAVDDHRATEAGRGIDRDRWPIERILERGYGVATVYAGDIDPDFDDGFKNGVHPIAYRPGQSQPGPDEWGTIAAWAWGLARALDYLETDPDVDARRVIVHGHSRMGKAALWAGAVDPRFALVISNESGEGGAALARRRFGETTKVMNTSFPHWFCGNFRAYNDREADLPVDQHMLLSLIAPRPVLVASAQGDLWADPRGGFLSAQGADPVYRLLGTDGLAARDMPGPNVLIRSTLGHFLRPGPHDVTDLDWSAFLDFADRHLGTPRPGA